MWELATAVVTGRAHMSHQTEPKVAGRNLVVVKVGNIVMSGKEGFRHT